MGLLTKPTLLGVAARVIRDHINGIYNDLYDILGTTTNGRGSLNYLNISATPDFPAEFITNTAGVLGGSTVQAATAPWKFSDQRTDYASTNRAAVIEIADGATTIAIVEPNKLIQPLHYANTSTVDAVIATITGATAGRKYIFIVDNDDAGSDVFFSNTATSTVNTFKHHAHVLADSSKIGPPASVTMMGRYTYGDFDGSGVNQWWED